MIACFLIASTKPTSTPVGHVAITTNATLQETRTLWYDKQLGQIYAYNHQGRAFLELLGDTREDGTRQHLGYEIVDVRKEPVKYDVTTELGDRVNAYQDGRDDTHLVSGSILNPDEHEFGYRHNSVQFTDEHSILRRSRRRMRTIT